MPLATKVEPIDRDVNLIINDLLSPQARSQQFAEMAKGFLDEADDTNRHILGRIPPSTTWVDGAEGRALETVKPDGTIVREYELVIDLLEQIADALRAVSPVRSGRYQASHTLFADGKEVPVGQVIPVADEYVFLSSVIYARKIEGVSGRKPESPLAPRGVYQITAAKFRGNNSARVSFAWRKPFNGGFITGHAGNKSDGRVPAIIVTVGR